MRPRSASSSRPTARRPAAAATPPPSSPPQLKDEGDSTTVLITTDLTISGKAAQFGRGVLADVSTSLIGQFAKNLEADLLGGSTASPCAVRRNIQRRRPTRSRCTADNAINSLALVKAIAPSLAKRYAPLAAGVAAGAAVGFLLGRRKRKSPAAVVAEDLQAALLRLLGPMSPAERLRP